MQVKVLGQRTTPLVTGHSSPRTTQVFHANRQPGKVTEDCYCTTQLKVSLTLGKFNHDIEAKHSHFPFTRTRVLALIMGHPLNPWVVQFLLGSG